MKAGVIVFIVMSFFCVFSAAAQEFRITSGDVAALQEALTEAAGNGENDRIVLETGTYGVTSTLLYKPAAGNPVENYTLTITGLGNNQAILDGGGKTRILEIDTRNLDTDTKADITIENLTFQDGATNGNGGGAAIMTAKAEIGIDETDFIDNSAANGGGVWLTTLTGDIEITDSEFQGNTADNSYGGVYINSDAGRIRVDSSTFTRNSADVDGGGIYLFVKEGTEPVYFTDNKVSENTAGSNYGGAYIHSLGGKLSIASNAFTDNATSAANGKAYAGLRVETTSGEIAFKNNSLKGNIAKQSFGGASLESQSGDITAEENVIQNNKAGNDTAGIGIETDSGAATLKENTISGNTAGNLYGGADVTTGGGGLTVTHNRVTGNQADKGYGGLSAVSASGTLKLINNVILKNISKASVGGARLSSANPETPASAIHIVNNTITANTATGNYGGLVLEMLDAPDTAAIYNNIIWGNTATNTDGADLYVDNDQDNDDDVATVVLTTNDYQEFKISKNQNLQASGNINTNPELTDNYYVAATSPAIDAGLNTAPDLPALDITGRPRTVDGNSDAAATVDMGAYEFIFRKISCDPSAVTFGSVLVGITSTTSVTITNAGGDTLEVTDITLSGDTSYSLRLDEGQDAIGSLPATIAPRSTGIFTISFQPQTEGGKTATLSVTSNDPEQSDLTVSVTGTGFVRNTGGTGGGGGGSGGGCFVGSLVEMLK